MLNNDIRVVCVINVTQCSNMHQLHYLPTAPIVGLHFYRDKSYLVHLDATIYIGVRFHLCETGGLSVWSLCSPCVSVGLLRFPPKDMQLR